MEWFEPIIAIVAIGLVFLPFILKIIGKKKGKVVCSSRCCCCPMRSQCSKNTQQTNNSKLTG